MILLPSDPAAERSYLASLMLTKSRRRLLRMLNSIKPAGRDVFNDPWHVTLYDDIGATWKAHGHCDGVLVMAQMRAAGHWVDNLKDVAGNSLPDLVAVFNTVPSAAHGEHYGTVILHLWRCRQVYTHAVELAAAASKGAELAKLQDALGKLLGAFE